MPQSFGITGPSGGGRGAFSLEDLIRPFTAATQFARPDKVAQVAEARPEAFLEWGGPATFTFENNFPAEVGFSFKVMQEVDRKTSTVRITNPNDESQFVDVERIDEITFAGGALGSLRLQLNN